MESPDTLRYTRIPLTHGSGAIPAVGFGTLISDPLATKQATKTALEVGFRHLDCAERYRNEEAVGDAMQEAFEAGKVQREDVFVTMKLWNTNHRPERVKPAHDASRGRLQLDYVDCYLIHTPFAFRPGDEQDPRDERSQVIYDYGVTLIETWQALERLIDDGQCKGDRLIRCYLGKAARSRCGCADQACGGASRIPSIPSSMGSARLLSGARDCASGVCSVGTRHESESCG